MASSSSSSSLLSLAAFFTAGSSSGTTTTVSQEEFNIFHGIDRRMFTHLVVNLGRDPAESTQIMGVLLWLERVGYNMNMIDRMLPFSDPLFNLIVQEAVLCLAVIEHDNFPPSLRGVRIPNIQNISRSDVTLEFFHSNRLGITRGITQLVNEVCTRAFRDIVENLFDLRTGYALELAANENVNNITNEDNVVFQGNNERVEDAAAMAAAAGAPEFFPASARGEVYYGPTLGYLPYLPEGGSGGAGPSRVMSNVVPHIILPLQHTPPPQPTPQHFVGPIDYNPRAQGVLSAPNPAVPAAPFDPYDLQYQSQILNTDLSDMLGRITLGSTSRGGGGGGGGVVIEDPHVHQEGGREVPPDDRTIFLTFSKGYPISEMEVFDFFTRRYGDVINAIFMQEVAPDEQVLYARLVVKTASIIRMILGGQSKAKFSINGKHVWARKYVRKQHHVATPSSPNSPAGHIN